ncbi:hypothetical protein [Nitrosomonas ureae]|uniref:Uncharacterized protein n=1 Tax=Nitrosomonas ureae TaxID=44577 RepID=A0A1H9AP51_9PROT|nr:hypothetical protein [Nitrosomonas ureae]SEP78480.1 hypothetical protein SAMN05421510_100479 [Nitrosomonas ureae]
MSLRFNSLQLAAIRKADVVRDTQTDTLQGFEKFSGKFTRV